MTLARDLAILLARIGIGAVFIAHGWQKLVTNGVDGTAGFFGSVGIPLPTAAAWFAALLEVGGGAALILGLLTPVFGVLLALNMLGAYVFVHAGKGMFVADGGAELVLALGVGALMIAAVGAGRFSVDALLTPMVRRRTAEPATA
ncbi:DoxX family protein [Catenuloplanes atrovinosus]|uniref:Oxidoreductase n=1 Tax=Catenuloplanes atrovinosus TaxID=137266 RepID=A0AAE3YMV9_9ACTN|nr:DoxX family protein [Catenuloplanes atrovinosus]MDR7275417.1 putative oxidoreductase [Catenuloplanes atrovinosus]